MKKISVFILIFSGIYAISNTQSNPASIDKTFLQEKIDSLVRLQWQEGQPGGLIAIVSPDRLISLQSYGLMETVLNLQIDENTLFDIASVSKQFTAFAIINLEREGKLTLDDQLSQYLPELPEYGNQITVRHLLQHTSGVASTDWLRLLANLPLDESWSQKDEIELIRKYSKLNFKPNSQFVYSNGGYALLAGIVEVVSGIPFSVYMAENVFKPLGMQSSFVFDHPEKNSNRLAVGYKMVNGNAVKESSNADYSYGGGNIRASMNDMIQWGQYMISDKNSDYLERISNPTNTLDNGDTIPYNFGFYVRNYKGLKMVEHSGGVPGFRNQFMIFPEEKLILIIMLNNESINSRRLANSIVDIILAEKLQEEVLKPRQEIELDATVIKAYEGRYRLPDGMEMTFSLEGDVFRLILPGAQKFELFAESETKFFLKAFDAQCSFLKSPDGSIKSMIWHQGGKDYPAQRVEENLPVTAEQLAMYAGNYIHTDLKTDYPVLFEDGKLFVQMPATFKKYLGIDKMDLNHLSGDKFATERLGMLEFTRNDKGEINGFIMPEMGRLQNVSFIKK
jgi:CubicO group peptidase (beta-lactamase class C family)